MVLQRQGVGSSSEPDARHLARKIGSEIFSAAGLHQHGVADQSDGQAFDFKGLTGPHDDGLEVRIFWQEFDMVLSPAQPFDGDFIA